MPPAVSLKKTADSEGHADGYSEITLETRSADTSDEGSGDCRLQVL